MPAYEHLNRYQLRYRPRKGSGYEKHIIEAVDKETGRQKGSFTWNEYQNDRLHGTGEIANVEVASRTRRQGLATAMYRFANDIAESSEGRIPAPEHSEARTKAGDAWARAVGGYLPPIWND